MIAAGGAARVARPAPRSPGSCSGPAGLLVVGLGRGGDVPLVALAICLLGALSWGVGNVVSRASGAAGGLALTVWSAVVVPVPLLAALAGRRRPGGVADGLAAFGWQAVLSTLYTAGLASLVGYGIFTALLVAQRRGRRGAVDPARARGRDGSRPRPCSATYRRAPRRSAAW